MEAVVSSLNVVPTKLHGITSQTTVIIRQCLFLLYCKFRFSKGYISREFAILIQAAKDDNVQIVAQADYFAQISQVHSLNWSKRANIPSSRVLTDFVRLIGTDFN